MFCSQRIRLIAHAASIHHRSIFRNPSIIKKITKGTWNRRSVGQVIQIVDDLIKHQIKFIAIKENIHLDGKQDIQSKVMVTMFGLFAEIERDLISERTCEGLAAAGAKGRVLGRPKGSHGI